MPLARYIERKFMGSPLCASGGIAFHPVVFRYIRFSGYRDRSSAATLQVLCNSIAQIDKIVHKDSQNMDAFAEEIGILRGNTK